MNTLEILDGRLTEKDYMPKKSSKYKVDYQGECIELTVYNSCGHIQNKYTIENDGNLFRNWCIENGLAKREVEEEYCPEDGYSYSVTFNTDHCIENNDLILAYCLEQIKADFP